MRFSRQLHTASTVLGHGIKDFTHDFWYQLTNTFLSSLLFLIALQMNDVLTTALDERRVDYWRLGIVCMGVLLSVALTQIKTFLSNRIDQLEQLLEKRAGVGSDDSAKSQAVKIITTPNGTVPGVSSSNVNQSTPLKTNTERDNAHRNLEVYFHSLS